MKKVLLLLLTVLMCGFVTAPLSAQDEVNTLTVADGSTTNTYVPVYGFWADDDQHNQIIYPESMLGDMVTGQISAMTFYLNGSPSWGNNVVVSLGITASDHFTSASHDTSTLTQVYSGTLSVSNNMWTITFTTPFDYNGGNLLFDLNLTGDDYESGSFYGISSTGGAMYQYIYGSGTQDFIPKTTFTYTGGALCKTPYGVTSSEIMTTSATISWHGDDNASFYNVQYMLASETDWTNATTVPAYDTVAYLTGLQPSSTYKVRVQVECSDNTQTVWSSSHSFITVCDAIDITDAWTETFEGYLGSGEQPFICWATPVQPNGPFVYCGWSASAHSGSNSAELKGAENVLVLPEFTNDLNTLRLTFWATAVPYPTTGTLEVGVLTDMDDMTSFELVGVCGAPGPRGADYSFGNGNLMGPFDFNNITATSGRIALRYTNASAPTASWNLDDFTVTFVPACAEPTNLVTGNVTATSAEISWNEVNGTTYDVVYWEIGGTDTTIVSGASLTDSVYILDNLNPSSSYTWYVRTDCGDGTYANAFQQLTFNTPGTPVELPYARTFEEGDDDPVTEFTFQGTGDNQWAIGTATFKPQDASDSTETGHSLYISNDNGVSNAYTVTSTSYAYAIINASFDESMEYHLSFDFKTMGEGGYSYYDYLSVYLMDASAAVPTEAIPSGTALLSQQYNVEDWTHVDYILENVSGTTKQIVFFWKNDYTVGTNPPAAIDNISIAGFTCAQPAQFSVTDIASDNVTIDWTEVGTSTSWTVSYGPAGYTVGDDDDEMTEVVTDHPYTITGLTPATSYDIYVQSDCGSSWAGPLTVTPGSFTMSATGNDTLTTCGLVIYDNGGADGNYSTNCDGILVLYPEDPDTKLSLTGTASIENNWDKLYIYDGVGTEGTLITTVTGENQTVNVLSTSGPLTLHFTSDGTVVKSGFELLAQCVSCFPPSNLSASDLDLTGATISWSGNADEYGVYVMLTDTAYYTATDTFLTLTGLEPSSTYRVMVRSLCGDDSSSLSQVFTFSTSCGLIDITDATPWFENFDGYTGTGAQLVGACWATPETQQVDNGLSPFVYCGNASTTYSGANSLEMKGGPTMVVLPEFSNDINTLRISMWGNTTAGNASGAGTMALGYISNINDPTTFVAIDTIPATAFNRTGTDAPHANFIGPYDFSGVTPQPGLRIALRLTDVTTSATGSSTSWNLDDITVALIPDCPSPVKTSVTITDVDGHNATVNFTDNNPDHSSWTVYYKTATDVNWSSETTSSTSVILTGLAPETSYEVYVVTNCNGTPSEDATNHKTFTTLVACPAPQSVTVSNIGMSTATVTWTSNADSFVIEYGEAGFTPGAGTSVTVTDNTYDLSGLTAGTAYTVYVTADCGTTDGVSTAASVNFNTANCEVADQCAYTFVLTDSYGDGWNGGSLAVQQNGITVTTLSALSHGGSYTTSHDTVVVNLCDNVSTSLVWTSGYYAYEASFSLIGPDGTEIYSFTGMDNYTTYTFTTDCNGTGPVITVPTVVTDLATNVTQTTATMNGTVTNPSGVDVTPMGFEWKVSSAISYTVVNVTGAALIHNLSGLTAGTQYTYKAFITYNGLTYYGEEVTFTTQQQGQPTEPSATTADATNVTYNSATLNGSIANPDNVTITAQGFQWKATSAASYNTVNATGATMTYNLTGLDASTGYTFRAFVTTANGTSYGQEKTFTTLEQQGEPCETPTGLEVEETDINLNEYHYSAAIHWDNNSDVDHWNVQYKREDEDWTTVSVNENSCLIENLVMNWSYFVRVQAVCGEDNNSDWSEEEEFWFLVGINSYLENSVTLYPNPANEYVDVRGDGDINVTGMEVYDVYGKVIRTDVGANNDSPIRINVSDLSAGMYFVRVTTEQGVVTKRFVKK